MVECQTVSEAVSGRVGEENTTDWISIDQSMINAFADVTKDHQFIHVDPEGAKQTPFGSTVAHGFLSLSLLSHFAEEFGFAIPGVVMAINYGFEKVRFINPVKSGSEIRAQSKVADITEKSPGQFLIKYEVTIEIKGQEKPALVADWLIMQITHEKQTEQK